MTLPPEVNPHPLRQQIYATMLDRKLFFVYTYYLCVHTCGGCNAGGWWLPRQCGTTRKMPSRIQTLMRDADGRRRKWCQIYCGYYFVQHRYCVLKIQQWRRGPTTGCGDSKCQACGTETIDGQLRRCDIIAYSRRKQPWVRNSTDNVLPLQVGLSTPNLTGADM